MAKRFKLRICRAINTTWHSCRSKHPSILPHHPIPSFYNHHHRRPSFKHHVSSAFMSINKQTPDHHLKETASQQFKWHKEDKWHVVANIYQLPTTPRRKICSSSEDDLSSAPPAPPPSSAEEKEVRGKRKKKRNKYRLRMSTSSADSGWFSSEGEETEILVSSTLSLSADSSSEFNSRQSFRHKRRVSKRSVSRPEAEELEIPARLSMLKKLIPCSVDGKVKESFAIVKTSEDPYEDFKNSMMDMIMEKQMFDDKDLEQLLQCFLSLNSRMYHRIIVEAFSEIWEAIFSPSPSEPQNHRHLSRITSV